MKKIFCLVLASAIYSIGLAQQWSGNDNTTDAINRNGNVGFGVNGPINPIDLNGVARFRRLSSATAGIIIDNGGALSLTGWGANNPYIEWRNSLTSRQGYMGWNTDRLSLILENGFKYTIEGGNVGIGSASPDEKLQVSGRLKIHDKGGDFGLIYHVDNQAETGYNNVWPDQYERALMIKSNAYLDGYGAGGGGFQFWTFDKNEGGAWGSYTGGLKRAMTIRRNGLVGIGTATPDEMLTVKGKIHSQEVKVDLAGAVAPDYVFETDYNLLPLSEVESYIKENKHLPEVPSAKQMEAEGMNLKEMNLILLKKVEELTLHLIEKEKTDFAMQEQIKALQLKIIKLENK